MKIIKRCVLVCFIALVMAACKKTSPTVATDPNTIPTTGTLQDKIKDSIYLFTQEDYLWYDAIPAYGTFKPRSFTGTTDILAYQKEVDALSQYKINPLTTKPYEDDGGGLGEAKYSFIDQGAVSTSLSGTNGDYGFSVFYNTTSDLRVKYVYPGSPADKAGLVRGYQILKINGSSSINYDGSSGTNVNFVVNAVFNSSSVILTLQKPDNSTFDVTLNTASYTVNPILKTKVIDAGNGKKIGYIVFNSFTVLSNSQTGLDAAFATFTSAGVTDVVVDLRYNGGGSVATSEHLANLLVPTAKSGSLMYTYYFNDKLQNDKYLLLAKKYAIKAGDFKPANNQVGFSKSGSLNISRVFFIVTGSTASASELTINNLIPEMNVQLIGSTTYGKPVGFFEIPISTYQLYIPEFETKNSVSAGSYYSGMTPGSAAYPGIAASDDVTHDFGDTEELLLARAIAYAKNGNYTITSTLKTQGLSLQNQLSTDQLNNINQKLSGHELKEMIETRLKKK